MKDKIQTAEDLLKDESFVQWVSNEEPSAQRKWEKWMHNDPDRRAMVLEAKELIQAMHFTGEDSHVADEELWNKIESTLTRKSVRRDYRSPLQKRPRNYLRAAAVVILAFLCAWAFRQYFQAGSVEPIDNPIVVRENPNGVKSRLQLPDGSKAWLNSGSKLSYLSTFSDTLRDVMLEGEAFFEVTKDEAKPFIVRTPYFEATVLGTSFSVQAYEGQAPKTSLVEGLVRVSTGRESKLIHPGEQAVVTGEELVLRPFDYNRAVGWKDGILYFDEDSLGSVFQKLEKWYDVKITPASAGLPSARYSGFHKDESLERVLEQMSYSVNFNYSIEDKDVKIRFH